MCGKQSQNVLKNEMKCKMLWKQGESEIRRKTRCNPVRPLGSYGRLICVWCFCSLPTSYFLAIIKSILKQVRKCSELYGHQGTEWENYYTCVTWFILV